MRFSPDRSSGLGIVGGVPITASCYAFERRRRHGLAKRPAACCRLQQRLAYLFSVAGGASRLYVFKGFLPGRVLFFTEARNHHALVLTERRFETLQHGGRVVPFMPEREAIQEFLHNFGWTMAPDKGFGQMTSRRSTS